MQKVRFGAATILIAALVDATFATASQAQETVSVGIDAAYAPFAFVKPDAEISGYEYDLVVAVCKKMNVTCNISNVPWDGIFASLESGNIQWIGTGVTITDERKAKYTISDPVYRVGVAMLVKKDSPATTYEKLKGQTIGTVAGVGTSYVFAKTKLGDDVDIRGYENIDAAVLDLDAGRISAVIGDNLQLQDQYVSKGGYKFVEKPDYSREWAAGRAWVFQKGDMELAERINAALARVIADGTHADIGKRYFGVPVPAQ